jgi:ABC-2 type transport system ATP-binding protein
VVAVDNLDLTLGEGEVVGLLGPNGAGKTTIIKCALGLIRPTAGTIAIAGHDVATQYLRAIEEASAVLEGARNVYWRMTPRENVRFFAGLHGLDHRTHEAYFEELLERFGLRERADEPLMNLSTGMKQKVAVVAALAKQTKLVFLDEPTLGLDVETSLELRVVLRDLARETRRTFVVSSHDMDVIQDVCERVVILKAGRVVADERVDNLLALFRTRAYRLVLSGNPVAGVEDTESAAGEFQDRLARLVVGLAVERRGRQTELAFDLPSANRLYEVFDLLRQSGASIETITQKEPDLEEAFLRVIRGGEAQ